MENRFIPQAVETVKQAIDKDNSKDYEEAYNLYQRSLEFFMTGLKYEQNPSTKGVIMQRVEGYMKRAEQLKELLDGRGAAKLVVARPPNRTHPLRLRERVWHIEGVRDYKRC